MKLKPIGMMSDVPSSHKAYREYAPHLKLICVALGLMGNWG